MNKLKLQFLYGREFWDKLENLLKNVEERVFILSAYIGQRTYQKYKALIPDGVFNLTLCRSDSGYKPNDALIINQTYFHGKLYLVDNTVIIGSQNLYESNKEGEFSICIETEEFNSSLILYQALLKLIEKEPINAEPVHSDFLNLYDSGCPFCGNSFVPDPVSLHTCPGYGGDFVSDEDCASYAGDGFCKFCLPENRVPIGEAICCDDSGCGLGISLNDYKLLFHAINPVSNDKLELAREYLKLFNFFKKQGKDAVEIFRALGFIGGVYKTTLERKEHYFVSYDIAKNLFDKLKEYEDNDKTNR